VRSESTSMVEQLLSAANMAPAQRVKPLKLNKRVTAAQALKKVMRQQLSIMSDQQQGIVDSIDSEFLNIYRIAVHRLQTLLRLARPLMPAGLRQSMESYCGELDQLISPARSADTYLLHSVAGGGEVADEELAPLRQFYRQLQHQQRDSYRRLCHEFTDERYLALPKLLAEWRPSKGDQVSAHSFICSAVAQQQSDLLGYGKKRGKGASDEELFKLLNRTRRLCDTLESFATLLPAKRVAASLQELTQLQSYLESFYDLGEQQRYLQQFMEQQCMEGGGDERSSCRCTVEEMVARVEKQRRKMRRGYGAVFAPVAKSAALKFWRRKRGAGS
ncbi:MAG: CHAD domain-containing protein, partial [Mariprofundales bacterium]|nr:CHAD domain-containing protein [Mariprofundales bacterium]